MWALERRESKQPTVKGREKQSEHIPVRLVNGVKFPETAKGQRLRGGVETDSWLRDGGAGGQECLWDGWAVPHQVEWNSGQNGYGQRPPDLEKPEQRETWNSEEHAVKIHKSKTLGIKETLPKEKNHSGKI